MTYDYPRITGEDPRKEAINLLSGIVNPFNRDLNLDILSRITDNLIMIYFADQVAELNKNLKDLGASFGNLQIELQEIKNLQGGKKK